jgi:hypothetical protein
VLEDLDHHSFSPEQLRVLRAVEVLEHAGTAEARQALESLARGASDAWVGGEAKAALDRLTPARQVRKVLPPK